MFTPSRVDVFFNENDHCAEAVVIKTISQIRFHKRRFLEVAHLFDNSVQTAYLRRLLLGSNVSM